jgi:hypothetical protein
MAEGGSYSTCHRRRNRLLQQQRKGREKVGATARWVLGKKSLKLGRLPAVCAHQRISLRPFLPNPTPKRRGAPPQPVMRRLALVHPLKRRPIHIMASRLPCSARGRHRPIRALAPDMRFRCCPLPRGPLRTCKKRHVPLYSWYSIHRQLKRVGTGALQLQFFRATRKCSSLLNESIPRKPFSSKASTRAAATHTRKNPALAYQKTAGPFLALLLPPLIVSSSFSDDPSRHVPRGCAINVTRLATWSRHKRHPSGHVVPP